jgi:hypothetical protein
MAGTLAQARELKPGFTRSEPNLSDEWDFYFARVNDAVSSIFVDLGIRDDVPVETRPWLLWVWVQLLAPKPDGLATNEESRRLHEIGESLDSLVSATCGAQLVGRITGNGRREYYFYAAEPGELPTSVATALKAFPEYKYETGSTFQPEWEQYLTLYPSETNLERMHNRRLLESLAKQGDSHEVPRKVDHWLHFGDEASRERRRYRVCPQPAVRTRRRLQDLEQNKELIGPLLRRKMPKEQTRRRLVVQPGRPYFRTPCND